MTSLHYVPQKRKPSICFNITTWVVVYPVPQSSSLTLNYRSLLVHIRMDALSTQTVPRQISALNIEWKKQQNTKI